VQTHLVYVGTHIPQQGYGAWVIVYRHLARLAHSKISVVHTQPRPHPPDATQAAWQYIARPQARFWNRSVWDASPHAYALRARFAVAHYAARLGRPNAILNVFGVNSIEACALARQFRIPLLLFLHDRWQVWTKPLMERQWMRQGHAVQILRDAARIWTVTPELATAYRLDDARVRVLRPIPEAGVNHFVEWRDAFRRPVLAFAGFVHDHHLEHFARLARALQCVDGRMLIMTDRAEKIRTHPDMPDNVDFYPPTKRNAQALEFVREHASAFVVPWSFGADLQQRYWDSTNFPSKLVEFAQLGLPLLLLAPHCVAVSNWAQARVWLGHCPEPSDANLQTLVAQVAERAHWEQMAQQTRTAALDEFNPAHIHAQFERELLIG
jgi:hypothetical protein